jgi:peptidyl-prolyl cis-trans isomerase SurA
MDMYKAKNFIDSIRTLIVLDSISFEHAANKFSEDKETNKNGGLMINPRTGNSIFENEQINPSIAYALKNVKEGEITRAFKTQDDRGQDVYKIVLVKEIIEPHTASIESDYQLIQDLCLGDKRRKYIDLWIKRKQKKTYIRLEDDYKSCKFKHPDWVK